MRILFLFGTRPEAIKLAPVIRLARAQLHIDPLVVVTGQHREMLDQALATFDIRPDKDLNIMRAGQDLTHVTTAVLTSFGELIQEAKPQWVVVQGDTTSAFAGALAAFYARVPVAHVEAGLRTGNIMSPWPEEINRRLVCQLSSVHFPPTPQAFQNLLAEGVSEQAMLLTGNTVIDAVRWIAERLQTEPELAAKVAASFDYLDPARRLILVTGHRRENFDGGLDRVAAGLAHVARRSDVQIVYAVHLNPVVGDVADRHLAGIANVHLVPPLDYLHFVWLMARADIIVTDSGGIQEEAPGLGKPVLVTRDTTERPEAIAAGTARLVGTDTDRLLAAVNELLDNPEVYSSMAQARNPFGDGHAAARILERLT